MNAPKNSGLRSDPPQEASPRRGLTPRRAVLLLVALVLVVGLGWLLRDFVRDGILLPLIDMGWVIWIFIQSVPQIVFWAMLVLGAMVAAGASLLASPPVPADVGGHAVPRRSTVSRFRYWQHGLASMRGSTFSRERILRELQYLVLEVLAEHDRIGLEAIRARLLAGELDLSREDPAIQALLDVNQRRSLLSEGISQPRGLRAWILRLLRRTPIPAGPDNDLDVPAIVAWLENETGMIAPERGDALGTEYR